MTAKREEGRLRSAAPERDDELWVELAVMTRDARQSGEAVRGLRTQLAHAFTFAARAAHATPQALEDSGQNVPDSPDLSESDRAQLRGWIAQLWKVIKHKPTRFPNKHSKMQYAFNCLRGVALGQMLPHLRDNGEIWPEDLPAFIQLLEAAFGDSD